MSKVIDLVGQPPFGRLTVVARAENAGNGKARFLCQCSCGERKVVSGADLRKGHTISCGCWRREMPTLAFATHHMAGSPEHRAWSHIKTRCFNEKSKFFHLYGGRGITMSAEWVASFEAFYRDMGPRPSRSHSVDRVENDGNYEHGNCRWATRREQANNRSTVRRITYDGVVDSIAGWARRTGVPYLKLRRRIVDGWTLERAFGLEKQVA